MSAPTAPRVSVIVPVYQSEATLGRCLDALGAQTFQDFEAIFVDSSPDEASARLLARRTEPWLRVERSTKRLWMHAARNLGVRLSRGEVVVFTDPDCVPEPVWLEELLKTLEEGPAAAGPVACYPGGPLEMAAHLVKYWAWLPTTSAGPIVSTATANLAVKRATFETLGGFSEDYVSADALLGVRLAALGYPAWNNPRALIRHIHHGVTVRGLVRERFARGRDFGLMRSSLPGWNRIKSLLLVLAVPVLSLAHLGRDLVKYAARRHFLRSIPAIPVLLACETSWMLGQGSACCDHLRGMARATLTDA